MGLTEEYQSYINHQKQEQNEKANQLQMLSKLPPEYSVNIRPCELSPQLSGLIEEFISLVPAELWVTFPFNSFPELSLDCVSAGKPIYQSTGFCIKGNCNYIWYAQALWPDSKPRMVLINYQNHNEYLNKSNKPLFSNTAVQNAYKQICSDYRARMKYYSEIIPKNSGGLTQRHIRIRYCDDAEYKRKGYLIIFQDGNVYDLFYEDEDFYKYDHSFYYPLKSYDNAKAFLLNILKSFQNNPRRSFEGYLN